MAISLTNDLKRFIAAEMSDTYISQFLQVDVAVVERARRGEYPPDPDPVVKSKRSPKTEPIRKRPSEREATTKLVPASRPFPSFTPDMTDGDRIIALTKHGLSARKIQRYLSQPYSLRQINVYATKVLGPPRKGNNSSAHWIGPTFMPYVEYCLKQLGKDKYVCELCWDSVPKGCVVHHTKYEGATIYDLMYICTSCNLARENKGLD